MVPKILPFRKEIQEIVSMLQSFKPTDNPIQGDLKTTPYYS